MYRCSAVRGRQSASGEGESKKSAMGKAMAAFRKAYGDAEGVKIDWQGEAAPAPKSTRTLEKAEKSTKARRSNPAPASAPAPAPEPAPERKKRRPKARPVLVRLPAPAADHLRRKSGKYQVVGYTAADTPHHVELVQGLTAARTAAGGMKAPVAYYTISKLEEAGALQ